MMFSRRDDVTLANLYGPPVRGWDQAETTMERAASLYRDGESLASTALRGAKPLSSPT